MSQTPNPSPTQIAGQQSAPSTVVPHEPRLAGSVRPTNNLAVVSFVAGLASFLAHVIPLVGGFTAALIAIITGFIARGQIKRTGEHGMWMANAGIIIGFIHFALAFLIGLFLLFLIFVVGVALFGISAHGGGSMPTPVPSG